MSEGDNHDHSDHDHSDHDHSKTFQPDHAEPTSAAARRGLALRELLIEQGVYTAAEEQAVIAELQEASPEHGARIVARAWRDPDFKKRLLTDGNAALLELGHELAPYEFTVLENTGSVHNVVVCTLCSCYPRSLLGQSPAWYKSKAYRSRVVREPRSVLAEFGVELDPSVAVHVHDSTAELRYLVLPQRPEGTGDWPVERLASLVTRDSLIGTQRRLT